MRIAQVTFSYKPVTGGADVWVDLLRRVCESAGHEMTVYQRPAEGIADPAVRADRSWVWSALGPRGGFWMLPLGLPKLRRELAKQDVLVVHYPNYHLFLEWHPRTVLVSHGVFWDDRPGALRSRIKRGLARRAFREARAVAANDTFFLREMGLDVQPGAEPFSEVAPGRFFVPNCIDTVRFAPTQPHPDLTEWPVVLVPRNLYRNRGVHLAIEAFARCAPELDGARLIVVGAEGQRGYLDHCRRLAEELGVGKKVVFFGAVPWEEMPAIYSAASVTVIPSLAGEGTSYSALESMGCGTPTITTNVAGLADLPTVQCHPTPESLAAALVDVWGDRQSIGDKQREIVTTVYRLENWERAWLRILDMLA